MRAMHEKFKQVVETKLRALDGSPPNCITMDLFDNYIKSHEAAVNIQYQLQIQNHSQMPKLILSQKLSEQLKAEQRYEIEELIKGYFQSGVKLLDGVERLVSSLKHQDNNLLLKNEMVEEIDERELLQQELDNLLSELDEQFAIQQNLFTQMDEPHQFSSKSLAPPNTKGQDKISKQGYFDFINKDEAIKQLDQQINKHFSTPNLLTSRKKKKTILSEDQIEELKLELKTSTEINKPEIQKKYDICESTLNRFIRRFKQEDIQINQNKAQRKAAIPKPTVNKQLKQKRDMRPNSKMGVIEKKVVEIYKKNPNILQQQVAQILSRYFNKQISLRIVSRCLKNIHKHKNQSQKVNVNPIQTKKYQKSVENTSKSMESRYIFAKQFLKFGTNNFIFIDEAYFSNSNITIEQQQVKNFSRCWDRVNFIFALMGNGRLLHWKIKNRSFKREEIAKFIEEVISKFPNLKIILENYMINEDQRRERMAKNGYLLYLPENTPQFNPIQNVFHAFVSSFKQKVRDNMNIQQILKIANQLILQMKQQSFCHEISKCKKCIQLSYSRKPLPISVNNI